MQRRQFFPSDKQSRRVVLCIIPLYLCNLDLDHFLVPRNKNKQRLRIISRPFLYSSWLTRQRERHKVCVTREKKEKRKKGKNERTKRDLAFVEIYTRVCVAQRQGGGGWRRGLQAYTPMTRKAAESRFTYKKVIQQNDPRHPHRHSKGRSKRSRSTKTGFFFPRPVCWVDK